MLSAVLLMLVAMSLIPLGDTAGKLLVDTHGLSPVFVAWARFTVGFAAGLPFLAWHWSARGSLRDWRIYLRGGLLTSGVVCILTALQSEHLGTVFGAFFVGPILSYGLSVLFLGERPDAARIVLLGIGFCGVLLVVKPGFGMTAGLGFAVLAGVFYGAYLTTSRWLAEAAPPGLLMLAQLAVGAVGLAAPAAQTWAAPPWPWGLLALSGLASLLGNLLLIQAYRLVTATALAPFVYFQLIAATLLGWLVWQRLPDALALIGLALLVGSGLASLALRARS